MASVFPTYVKATSVPRESRPQPRSFASRVWVSDCRPNRHPLELSTPLKVSTAIYNRHPIELVSPHLFPTRRVNLSGLATPPVATPCVQGAVLARVASAVRTVRRFQTTATVGCCTQERRLVVVGAG